MLGRSQSTRFDHNQENPHAHLHHKTPARAGKAGPSAGPAPVTGGKGALQQQTAKSGRVLGAKDRNGGKNGQPDPSTLLFSAKPGASTSQAQAGPSCAPRPVQQQFKTPLPNKTFRPAQELRTPATALRPRHAPSLMLGSPDVSMDLDVEEEEQEQQEEEDREVEYAGPSARDYDEPYLPDFPVPDFKTAGYGAAVRSMPLAGVEDAADWAEQDALERSSFKAELDEGVTEHSALSAPAAPQPLFPAPKRRAPLGAKPANTSYLSSSVSGRAHGTTSLAGSSAASSARKAPAGSALAPRRPVAASTAASAPGSTRTSGPASSKAPLRGGMQPPSKLGPMSTKPGSSTATKATSASSLGASRPLLARATSTASSLLGSSAARPRPPPLALPLSRPASSSSLRSANSTSAAPLSPAQVAARRKADEQAAERELGVFGLVEDDGVDLAALEAFQFGDEDSFKLDLDIEL
ncbi:hypothetical protein JCM3775_006920 [Rhodotorula graminis]|uniref:Uncharacterized protein n=1 Tax=Rhodotorula graminis (strain WP1) TaxID=578459 RepID=A0A194SAX5_RHOGW|nr:uncharacterized protein RHOBADRAFT_51560 [Rhodotorula graminis WP1]KPV77744.1 hypothetical protein RHOBADRAFT_51560 [Rhodotorula graminis WP1]